MRIKVYHVNQDTGAETFDCECDLDDNGSQQRSATMIYTTPEQLAGKHAAIPAWALGTQARLIGEKASVDAWDLYRGDDLIGCMYDAGAGYIYIEGCAIADGDWEDSGMPWARQLYGDQEDDEEE